MDEKSITIEEFKEKYVPMLNTAGDLIINHPDIPEEVNQGDVLSSIQFLASELEVSLKNRVPEIVKLQEAIERKDKQIKKLQETNQQLFLKVGSPKDPKQNPDNPQDKPKKTFQEIKAMMDSLPGG